VALVSWIIPCVAGSSRPTTALLDLTNIREVRRNRQSRLYQVWVMIRVRVQPDRRQSRRHPCALPRTGRRCERRKFVFSGEVGFTTLPFPEIFRQDQGT